MNSVQKNSGLPPSVRSQSGEVAILRSTWVRSLCLTGCIFWGGLDSKGILRAETVPQTHPHPAASEVVQKIPITAVSESDLGIAVQHLRLSARGRMVDFRYRVTDPTKAAVFSDRETHAYLLHPATGTRLPIPSGPKTGPLRQLAKTGGTNSVLFSIFANPGLQVKSGSSVALVVGNRSLGNLVVE